jgi:hypothetical protein
VDKLFNPFTLLVGPVLVAIVVYKSTKPVDKGGFHLPWWCVSFCLGEDYFVHCFPQERNFELHGVAHRNPNGKIDSTSLESSPRYRLRPRLHSLRLLLCCHENLRLAHVARGLWFGVYSYPVRHLISLRQTGWGTRAGVGGATEALNALDAQDAKESGTGTLGEKFQNSPSFPSSYPADDGRRYDPETLNYGPPQHQGYAR